MITPAGTLQPEEWRTCAGGGGDRVGRDGRGERVGGVDDGADVTVGQIRGQSLDPVPRGRAEAADPDLAGGQCRVCDPAGEGADDR